MIKVVCVTNLDEYRNKKWPTKLAVKPVVGETIRSIDGFHGLRIMQITHCSRKVRVPDNDLALGLVVSEEPYLELYLNG